jgi:hypothetical protein
MRTTARLPQLISHSRDVGVAERDDSMSYRRQGFGAGSAGVFRLQTGMLGAAQMRLFSTLFGHSMRVPRVIGEFGRSLMIPIVR